MRASREGRTETVQALLAAPDIDVNHADVSVYSLTPSHVVVGGDSGEVYLPLSLILTLVLMSYHPPTSKMYPSLGGNILTPDMCLFLIVYYYPYCIITLFSS